MAAEGGAAALLDSRHDLQLTEAQVAPLMLSPGRPVGAEDIRGLQGGALHARLRGGRGSGSQWTDHLAQDLGGDMGIERCRLELLVAEQDLDHSDVHLLFEQVGREAVSERMERDALVDPSRQRSLMHGAVELSGGQGLDRVQAWEEPPAIEHLALGTGDAPPPVSG